MKKKTLLDVLKKIIVILVIILVSLISFLGIHKKNLNNWNNILPEYDLSKELSNIRIFGFSVDDSTEMVDSTADNASEDTAEDATSEVSTTDTTEEVVEENTTDSESEDTASATTEVPVNDPSILTKENYIKSKKIIEERLKKFGITDATVSVNDSNGDISISVPYEDITDYTVSLAGNQGTFEIIDTDTEEVLISKNMLKSVSANYQLSSTSQSTSGQAAYDIGIAIELTKDGQSKLNEMTKKYIETMDENGETTQKTVTVKIDGETKYITYFSPDGTYTQLFIPIYQSVSVENMSDFNDKLNECAVIQAELSTESLPIVYQLAAGTFIESNIAGNTLNILVFIGITVLVIIAIVMIVKYKKSGLLVAIIELGFVAIHLLLIRAAGVSITFAGLVMILLMALLNYMLLIMLMNKEKAIEQLEAFGSFILNIIPFIITIIVFVVSKDINLQSVGMVGIWAIFVLAYTLLASILLLRNENTKKNGVE